MAVSPSFSSRRGVHLCTDWYSGAPMRVGSSSCARREESHQSTCRAAGEPADGAVALLSSKQLTHQTREPALFAEETV